MKMKFRLLESGDEREVDFKDYRSFADKNITSASDVVPEIDD